MQKSRPWSCARARVSDLLLSAEPLNKLSHVTLIDMRQNTSASQMPSHLTPHTSCRHHHHRACAGTRVCTHTRTHSLSLSHKQSLKSAKLEDVQGSF